MARIVPGPMVTDVRGKLGDVVYSRNRGGPVALAYHQHNTSNTAYQAASRAMSKAVVLRWNNTLTEAQRQTWIQMATLQLRHRSTGFLHPPSGIALFRERNHNTTICGGGYLDTAPLDLPVIGPGLCTLTANSSTQTLTLTPTVALPGGYGCYIKATPNLNAGINSFNRWMRGLYQVNTTLFSDTFAGTAPVPPWTAAPTYVAADWPEAANTLTTAGAAGPEDIYANIAANNYTISCSLTLTGLAGGSPCLTARVQTSTGQRYILILQPLTNVIAIQAHPSWTPWNPTAIGSLPWSSWDTNPHTYTWTLIGPYHTIARDGTTVGTLTDTTLLTGPPGLVQHFAIYKAQNYSALSPHFTQPAPIQISQPWIAKYGPILSGKKIGAILKYVNLSTGQTSGYQSASCTAT